MFFSVVVEQELDVEPPPRGEFWGINVYLNKQKAAQNLIYTS